MILKLAIDRVVVGYWIREDLLFSYRNSSRLVFTLPRKHKS